MRRAYVGVITASREARDAFRARLPERRDPRIVTFSVDQIGNLLIATRGLQQVRARADSALVLGRVATRGGGAPAEILEAAEVEEPAGIARRFVERCWGGYVAFFASEGGRVDIWRAPFGDLPCYYRRERDAVFVASSPRLLSVCAARPLRVDRHFLVRHLAVPHLRFPETCLEGVDEVPGGQGLAIVGGTETRSTLWSPWTWTRRDRLIFDREEAASNLLSTARECVASCAEPDRAILLKLSGGLDSSVVASCLAHAGIPFRALNLVTDDASGDERSYARMVAGRLGAALVECRRDPSRVNLARSPARDLARPSIPLFRQESERIAFAEARRAGLSLLMDGGGGDNVFCSLQSASPVADCLLVRQGRRHLGRTISSLAEIAHVSMAEVLCAGVRRVLRRSRDYRWPLVRSYLSADASASLAALQAHPWLRAPRRTLPGSASHVALLAAAQSYVEGLDPEAAVPLVAPLLAQPLVELCLRIPSWLWFDEGLNRAVTRHGFARDLPAAIVRRRFKGSPDAFVAQLFEHHAGRIREDLVDGELVALGLLDRAALLRTLEPGVLLREGDLQRIMSLYDAEIWSRGWSG
jgi:asparagine synthase (glutamine-hydrolysing)